jgi:phage FluMu protein Com
MNEMRCRDCYKLLAKIGTFDVLEIKCTRCRCQNIFMNTASVTPERPELPKSGTHHESKRC